MNEFFKIILKNQKRIVYQVVSGILVTTKDSRVPRDSYHRTATNTKSQKGGSYRWAALTGVVTFNRKQPMHSLQTESSKTNYILVLPLHLCQVIESNWKSEARDPVNCNLQGSVSWVKSRVEKGEEQTWRGRFPIW